MRIYYAAHGYNYELEPVYWLDAKGLIVCHEVRLYNRIGEFKGVWMWKDIPSETRLHIRSEIRNYEKRSRKSERLEKVRTRSMIGKTK